MASDQSGEDPTPEDPALVALTTVQEQLAQEKEERREERFVWIIVSLILLNLIILAPVTNAATPIVILILELVGLGIAVRRMGIKNAIAIINRVTTAIAKKKAD